MKKKILQAVRLLTAYVRNIYDNGMYSETLALVFAQRNRAYGAFALRSNYHLHMRNAMLYSFSGILALFTLLSWPQKQAVVETADKPAPKIIFDHTTKIKIIPEIKPKVAATTPQKIATTAFKPPILVPDPTVVPVTQPLTTAQLLQTSSAIGSTTSSGGSETGVGIAEGPSAGAPSGSGIATAPEPEPEIHDVPEQVAAFAGGEKALLAWLSNQIQYPAPAVEAGIQGRVYVQFVVELDGSVTQIKLLRDIGGGCGREALRVVNQMPKWTPARQNGHAVRSRFTVPVFFQLR